jgi:hypothetical protein
MKPNVNESWKTFLEVSLSRPMKIQIAKDYMSSKSCSLREGHNKKGHWYSLPLSLAQASNLDNVAYEIRAPKTEGCIGAIPPWSCHR